MAIQLPNPGLGDGQTGDNEYVMWTKVKDNFSNTTHAASRLVGTATGNLVASENIHQVTHSSALGTALTAEEDVNNAPFGITAHSSSTANIPSTLLANNILTLKGFSNSKVQIALPYGASSSGSMFLRLFLNEIWYGWETVYTSANTTKDSNGFLKGKSPVTRLFSDRLEHQGNDKELEEIEFKRLGVGDYLLKNTTGLASEGWYIELPQDANKNPLIAVTYSDDGKGNLSIKTYKRRFDFETVSIVADTDNPVDIPETRWIDLRFNEIKQEQLDEPTI